jgi:hypothetical protein
MKKLLGAISLALGGVLLLPTSAHAAVTFDPATGIGFAGKGDVQLAFGWSNSQLQANAAGVTFRSDQSTVKVTEVSWQCQNDKNEKTQERQRTTTTTTTTSGVVTAVARDNRNQQITGFNLTGYSGKVTIPSSTTDGPPVNSCPDGPWTLDIPAGDPAIITESSSGTLSTIYNGDSRTIYSF